MLVRRPYRSLLSKPFACAIFIATGSFSHAAVTGYWRFESGAYLEDSSGNGRTLGLPGTPADPTQATLPGAGAGSAFSDPIPFTGAANSSAASFDGGDRFVLADEAAFTDNTFTIEAFVNFSADNTSQKSIAGHWNSTGDQRSWLFAVNGDERINLLFSPSGVTTTTVTPVVLPVLQPGKDYYVAATVNMADTGVSGITFYVQNLTDGGELLSEGVAHTQTSLVNVNTQFTIGATAQPSSNFSGLIDEVRLSNEKLTASQLLVVPEPSSLALLSLGGLLAFRRRR